MNEVSTTRLNHLIDPNMHIWGWEIPVYLFLGGIVAGMMIITGWKLRMQKGEYTWSTKNLPILSIILLSAGMFALWLDLEHRWYFWRLYLTFKPLSPMSWGSWILILVYPLLAGVMIMTNREHVVIQKVKLVNLSRKIEGITSIQERAGGMLMLLGTAVGIYTGILLSAFGARPLWNSSVLWLLFVVSGLSTAAALTHILTKDKEEQNQLVRTDNMLILAESGVLALFITGLLSGSGVQINAAKMLIAGSFAPVFWVFVVIIGLLLPYILQTGMLRGKIKHSPAAAVLVLAGGLILRFVIVYAGQASHW